MRWVDVEVSTGMTAAKIGGDPRRAARAFFDRALGQNVIELTRQPANGPPYPRAVP